MYGYPNINFNYTKTHVPVFDKMPPGYRWADEVEVDYWWHIEGAVHVVHPGQVKIAVPIDLSEIDMSAYHS